MNFTHKLATAQQRNNSWLGLRLDLQLDQLPLPLASVDDPLQPFAHSLIDATRDLVSAYIFDPAYFLAEGAAGMLALERIIRYVPEHIPIVLDTRFGAVGSSASPYARAVFDAFRVDASTFSVVPEQIVFDAFLKYAGKAVFVPLLALLAQHPSLAGGGLIVEAKELPHLQLSAINVPLLITQWTVEVEARAAKAIGISGVNPIIDLGAAIIYTSRGDDFATVARAQIRKARDRINAFRPQALAAL